MEYLMLFIGFWLGVGFASIALVRKRDSVWHTDLNEDLFQKFLCYALFTLAGFITIILFWKYVEDEK